MKTFPAKKITVNIDVHTQHYRIPRKKIQNVAACVLRGCAVRSAEVTILLVTDSFIRRLNKRYKKRNTATDVLAFPFEATDACMRRLSRSYMGDIVISLDQAKKNACRFGGSFTHELLLYVIHGVLHILGYDDIQEKDRRIMEEEQSRFFRLCVVNKS